MAIACFGFRFGGLDKITSHLALYSFDELQDHRIGQEILEALEKRLANLPALMKAVEDLRIVTPSAKPTRAEVQRYLDWARPGSIHPVSWYDLIYTSFVGLTCLDIGVMCGTNYLIDGNFTGGVRQGDVPYWGYLINLDDMVWEVYGMADVYEDLPPPRYPKSKMAVIGLFDLTDITPWRNNWFHIVENEET